MKFRLSIARSIHTTMIVALNAIAVHAAHATDSFAVEDIRVDGLRHTEPSAVFAYLQLKVGDTFTDDKASAALRALYATGLFTDVSVSVDGSTVVFDVKERAAIGSVDFAGIHEFDKANLSKAMSAVGLSNGRMYDTALVDKAEQELKRQYLTRGYYAAEVTTTVTPIDRNRVSILFSVVEGPSARIRQVEFIGNRTESTPIRRHPKVT
jgi:outer membrane protein insertion porin family